MGSVPAYPRFRSYLRTEHRTSWCECSVCPPDYPRHRGGRAEMPPGWRRAWKAPGSSAGSEPPRPGLGCPPRRRGETQLFPPRNDGPHSQLRLAGGMFSREERGRGAPRVWGARGSLRTRAWPGGKRRRRAGRGRGEAAPASRREPAPDVRSFPQSQQQAPRRRRRRRREPSGGGGPRREEGGGGEAAAGSPRRGAAGRGGRSPPTRAGRVPGPSAAARLPPPPRRRGPAPARAVFSGDELNL